MVALGWLHQLDAVLGPMTVNAFGLIGSRRAITGSPSSSPPA